MGRGRNAQGSEVPVRPDVAAMSRVVRHCIGWRCKRRSAVRTGTEVPLCGSAAGVIRGDGMTGVAESRKD